MDPLAPSWRRRRLAATVAFCAGLAGLIDEIVQARALSFRLGTTTFAAALVASMLILGWGLGALLAGRLRLRPAPVLLGSQGIAALFSVAVPAGALGLGGGGALACDVLLLGGVLLGGVAMGMAIPTLLELPAGAPDSPRRLGGLNGWNGLGALLGALLAGFALLRWWGIYGAAATAACGHLLAALIGGAIASGLGRRRPAPAQPERDPAAGIAPALASWLAFVAGFATLAVQLLATRWLLLYFLGFAYVFSAITGLALAAYGLGSFLGPTRAREPAPQARRILALLLLAGLSLALAPLLLGQLPGTSAAGPFTSSRSAPVQYLGILVHAAALTFLPVFALAALAPMAYAGFRGSSRRRGAAALFWSGLGSALAPWVCALVLIPAWGSLRTWMLVAALLLASAAGCALARARTWPARAPGLIAALAALACLFVLAWPGFLSSALLYRLSPVMRAHPEFRLLHAAEDASFAVAVVDDGRRAERTLFTDNFRAAGTGEDYVYMRFLGTVPLHLEPRPERVLVIAFGTGTTAGAVAAQAQVKELDIVEISGAVKALRGSFRGVNGALDEPRPGRSVRWHLTDGRRYLETTARRFQAITLEPLLPYAPAAVHLYTREFYELVRARLAPGGTLTHWIPATGVSPPEVAALVRTFAAGFEHAGLWLFGPSLVLVGSERPLRLSAAREPDRTRLTEALAWITDRAGMLRLPSAPELSDAFPWIEFLGTRPAAARLRYFHDNLEALLAIYSRDPGGLLEAWPPPQGFASWSARRAIGRRLLEARLREERERLDRFARRLGRPATFELDGPDALARYEEVDRADHASPVIHAELGRALHARYLEECAATVAGALAHGALLFEDLRPRLRRLRELARRASALRPYRFEAWLYLGAAEYLLGIDPDLPPQEAPRRIAAALRPWLRAAALYPRCFEDALAHPLRRLLGAAAARGELSPARLMSAAAGRGLRAANTPPVTSLAGLRKLLAAARGAERYGDAWLVAFRSVQLERALWQRLHDASGADFPPEYRDVLLGPR